MTSEIVPYVPCYGCAGRGFVKGPVDEATGKRVVREHDRCNGAGILILNMDDKAGGPFYRAPQLRPSK